MDFLNNPNFKFTNLLKIAGIAIVVIVVLSLAFRLISSSFNTIGSTSKLSSSGMPSAGFGGAYMESADSMAAQLSARNVILEPGYSSGSDAEDFEVTDYRATIETRDLDSTCGVIFDLKQYDYVIFENTNAYDTGCNYSFKVTKDRTDEVLAVVESLDPRDLITSTITIKNQVEDFTSELDILNRKRQTIEQTLNNAIVSYDEIALVATGVRDAESLSKIIDSKIRIIEKLTQERINVSSQIDRLQRSKAQQLDRLEYTFFGVTVFERKYIDGEQLKDSWQRAVQEFVQDVNKTLQDISINLVAVLFRALLIIVYLLIILVVAKYGWKFIKNFWYGKKDKDKDNVNQDFNQQN